MEQGETEFVIDACGQQNIGGPLWDKEGRALKFLVRNPGQRVGSMGMPGTEIVIEGSAPADVGWLNSGALIVLKGDGGDTTGHCAAGGVIYVGGRSGARSGSLMKHDPTEVPPQLWILKETGPFSFEFMSGGTAVVCGQGCEQSDSVLGSRPCIGMVGGVVYVRGPVTALPVNVEQVDLQEEDWAFLCARMPVFLRAIERFGLLEELLHKKQWRKIVAKKETRLKQDLQRRALRDFHARQWFPGGLFGDVLSDSGIEVPLVPIGEYRAMKLTWQNNHFSAPCEYACPCGIPTQDRINLLRKGKLQEALSLVLQYNPFPGSVCGAACPNPCLKACTRGFIDTPIAMNALGALSLELPAPQPAPSTGKRFAVIGSGAGGLAAAWHLALGGHQVTVFEKERGLGGKMAAVIPQDRLPKQIVQREIDRVLSLGIRVQTGVAMTPAIFQKIYEDFDGVIVAVGAHHPTLPDFPGKERVVSALSFLANSRTGRTRMNLRGKRVVVVGAGDVGMDVCCVAWKLGARSVRAVDIREPKGLSQERTKALHLGTIVLWPRVIREWKEGHLFFQEGEPLAADLVVAAIGETPDIDWLPGSIKRAQEQWLEVNATGQTRDPKVFAVGDAVKPGLLAEAIGSGRMAALALHARIMGEHFIHPVKQAMPLEKLNLSYFRPRMRASSTDPLRETERCISCGTCRDCGICVAVCGQNAIRRLEDPNGDFEFRVDETACIGCGFCAAACPSGIWTMKPNILDEE
jgi:NADPH-dependent glutamate synthase beta subunit-like oxidoreductase/ferredoxin